MEMEGMNAGAEFPFGCTRREARAREGDPAVWTKSMTDLAYGGNAHEPLAL